ncbi:MAG: Gfo/Idh/MocA family protein [Anaerolineaceae bacterium]
MTENTTCKVAIIGGGYMAAEHARAFIDLPGVSLAGIFSRTKSRAEELAHKYSVPIVADSIASLFERTQADLVIVTVTELNMNPVTKECFKFPWTLMLEKPAGYNLKDAEEIFENAERQHSRVFVAFNRRCFSSTRAGLVDLETSDERRFIKVQDQQNVADAKGIGQPDLVASNYMFANSVHVIDYFRVFGRGNITNIESVRRWDPENPGIVISQVEFDTGDYGLYEGIWDGPGPWAVNVTLPSRRWEFRPLEQAGIQRRGERKISLVEQDPLDAKYKPGLFIQAGRAVDAALGKPTPLATLADSLETMRLVDRIFK